MILPKEKGTQIQIFTGDTVDGWNPAPPGMYETP